MYIYMYTTLHVLQCIYTTLRRYVVGKIQIGQEVSNTWPLSDIPSCPDLYLIVPPLPPLPPYVE